MRTDDRITGITHVKLGTVPNIGFLDFRAETNHTIGTEMAISSDKGIISDNSIRPIYTGPRITAFSRRARHPQELLYHRERHVRKS